MTIFDAFFIHFPVGRKKRGKTLLCTAESGQSQVFSKYRIIEHDQLYNFEDSG